MPDSAYCQACDRWGQVAFQRAPGRRNRGVPGKLTPAATHAAMPNPASSLRTIKLVHTAAWAVFAGCILAIPIFLWRGELDVATGLIVVVMCEVAVLAANGMKCPLTAVAARYTDDRRDNFDIYLPLWLARYNKEVFGTLFAADLVYALVCWLTRGEVRAP